MSRPDAEAPRLVAAGGLRLDYLVTREGRAHVGLVGGNAVYAAIGASHWADEVALWARAGRNYPVERLAPLQAHGIALDGVVGLRGDRDHRTFYAYAPDGGRHDVDPATHFARAGIPLPAELEGYLDSTPGQEDPEAYEPLALRPGDWPVAYDGAAAAHFSPMPLASHRALPPELRARGVRRITCDPGERYMVPERREHVRHVVALVDAFLPSASEVRSLFGPDIRLPEAATTLCDWGAPLVVIKNGRHGVLLLDGSRGALTELPPFHAPDDPRVVDVTGAGDAFCGAFAAGLERTGDPVLAARMGLASASLVVEGFGALFALDRKDAARRRLAAPPR